ncbi:MAG: DNA primase [Clostridia bacterium]|nr:DNA primase [Clostridia bacterium]
MSRIPQNIIEDIKYRNPIEDVISSYVTLTRAGSNMKGLCPFHSEKTPSFTVYTGSSSFYCFGCGAGGDVVSFIMRAENLDYPSAIEYLAKRVGITLPEFNDANFYQKGVSRSRVLEMNVDAAKFFREKLFDDAAGAAARAYLLNRRLGVPIIKRFGIGYAPNSFGALHDHLKGLGYKDEEMIEAALCRKSEKTGGAYDFFRNRIMFPLIDTSGNIVAFGGRSLDEKPLQKYMNSTDTPAFNKRKTLFGLNFAKNHASDGLILVEGNVDVVTLHQAGFENAVATLGTAITEDHARLIKKYTDLVYISYDSDEAGVKATDKAVRKLDEVGIDTRMINIEGAKDPDEYIVKYGTEAFRKLIERSRNRFDFIVKKVTSKYDLLNDEDKVKAARELAYEAAKMSSKVERDIFASKVADVLEINRKSFEIDVASEIRKRRGREKREEREEIIRETSGISDRVNRDFAKNPRAAKLEETALGIMLICPEFIQKNKKMKYLTSDDFITDYGKRLFGIMMGTGEDDEFDFSVLNEKFTPDEVSRAQKLITSRMKLSNTDDVFREAAEALRAEASRINNKTDESTDDDITAFIKKRREEK